MAFDRRVMDDTKICLHMDRVKAYYERGERIAPIHIDLGISKACNCACNFCYGLQQKMTGARIDPDVLVATLADAPHLGVRSIAIVGDGDPTMNRGFYDGLRAGYENGLDLSTSTNGILVDNEDRQRTILDTCVWARFNLNSHNRESYKKIHGVDKFDKVVENIKNMVALKNRWGYPCDFGLQMVFVPGMMNEEVVRLSELAVEWGVNYLVVKQCALPVDNKAVGTISFDVNEYDKPEVIQALKTAESLSTDKTKIVIKWNIIKQKGKRPYSGCPSIPFLLEGSGDGSIYPCGQLWGDKEKYSEYYMGNLHEISLREILASERYWQVVEKMRRNFDVHTQCFGACRQDKVNEWLYHYERADEWSKKQIQTMCEYVACPPMGKSFI